MAVGGGAKGSQLLGGVVGLGCNPTTFAGWLVDVSLGRDYLPNTS